MLSRIAESLYWMSRYLERADNTARLMEINLLYMVEAEEHLSEAVLWRPLLSIKRQRSGVCAVLQRSPRSPPNRSSSS